MSERTETIPEWNARRVGELEAELAGYRDGKVQAWSAKRIIELETENAELREAVGGVFSPAARSRVVVARTEYLLENGRRRKRDHVSKRTRWEVMERDEHRCVYCGADPDNAVLVIDHVLPAIDGGTNDIDNLVTSCQECNEGKADRPPIRRI